MSKSRIASAAKNSSYCAGCAGGAGRDALPEVISTSFISAQFIFTSFIFTSLIFTGLAATWSERGFAAPAVFLDKQGRDTRGPMNSVNQPWSSIGKVKNDELMCTGALVGARLIATAAHCVVENGKLAAVNFYPNFMNGSSNDKARSVNITVGSLHPSGTSNDWALVVLDKKLAPDYGYFECSPDLQIPLPLAVTFAGYSLDYQKGKTATVDHCTIHERLANGNYGHDCSMTYGASGAPLFYKKNGKFYLTGINARGEDREFTQYTTANSNEAVWSHALCEKIKHLNSLYQ